MITFTFRPVHGEGVVLVRGAFFRICADGSLRGPDNCVMGTYTDGFWEVGRRHHCAFECGELIHLRVLDSDGTREQLGPYDFVRVTEGALFTRERCLGIHASNRMADGLGHHWQEIAFLSARPA